jgi:presenilin-like A22 family membrane protease
LLMIFVMKGKPQAGLPYLCSGAILGYLISSYIFL